MTFRKTDAQLREVMPNILDYVDAIQILKVIEVDDDGKHYDTEDKGMKDTTSISIHSYYHETITDPGKETVKEAKRWKVFRPDSVQKCLHKWWDWTSNLKDVFSTETHIQDVYNLIRHRSALSTQEGRLWTSNPRQTKPRSWK